MNDFTYHVPTKFVFGRGSVDAVGDELASLGHACALVVYGKGSVVRTGTLERVLTSLDRAGVRHAQRLRDLTGKVEIAGVVDKVQLALVIFHRNDGRGDGILSLLLFVVKVGNGRAVGAFAETGDRLGGEQHALAQGGLAVAAVSQQADVADVVGSIGHS